MSVPSGYSRRDAPRPGLGVPSRAEPSRAHPPRAEPSRAEPSRIGRGQPIPAQPKQFRPKEVVYPEKERLLRLQQLKRHATLIGATVGLLAVALVAYVFLRPPEGCDASPARRRAAEMVAAHRDRTTGDPLESRFPRDLFQCSDVAAPAGVLVSASEQDDAPPATWFVDTQGRAYNVNMLALAWTPELPAAPEGVGRREAGGGSREE